MRWSTWMMPFRLMPIRIKAVNRLVLAVEVGPYNYKVALCLLINFGETLVCTKRYAAHQTAGVLGYKPTTLAHEISTSIQRRITR
jgi:hypothetical protein